MKTTVKTTFFLVLVSILTLNVSAQKDRDRKPLGAEEQAAKHTEWMTQKLDLNETQQVEVKALHLKYIEKMKDLRNGENKDKIELQNWRKEKQAELKEILTAEQWEKYQNLKKERKGKIVKHSKSKRDCCKKAKSAE